MIRQLAAGSLFITLCLAPSHAQVKASDDASRTSKGERTVLEGIVVDAACARDMANKPNTMEKAAAHTKKCALEDMCAPSGYGVFSEGAWYKFDAAGDKKAKSLIEKTKRKDNIRVVVTGTKDGDNFAVLSIKESKNKAKKK